jgi:hypothetical protein
MHLCEITCVEHDLACHAAIITEVVAVEFGAILEHELGFLLMGA